MQMDGESIYIVCFCVLIRTGAVAIVAAFLKIWKEEAEHISYIYFSSQHLIIRISGA